MMEKEDEGAGEEDGEGDEADTQGEPGGPMDMVMVQAQESVSQSPQQENKIQDMLMEDAETISEVTDLSSSLTL
jgi:hypothetical protein